eukprot:TRINITY_DN99752_c0_g1_i1.p1 TRINITY_DN99752_c0_g1~~TRINITY_DN99752_c0_g1_i1.p1  ORF type:complete len:209 (+),score=45.55 TRINITY_DN99752_c0_g1_i1:43-669(+)
MAEEEQQECPVEADELAEYQEVDALEVQQAPDVLLLDVEASPEELVGIDVEYATDNDHSPQSRPLRYSELREMAKSARGNGWKKPRVVRSVRYIPPPSSPNARAIESLASQLSSTGSEGLGNSLKSFSSSTPSLRPPVPSAPPSRPGTGLPPPSRAGSTSSLKGLLGDLKSLPPVTRSIIAAGVDQAQLNPSIPFSGFPSLTYLRGSS